MLRIPRIFHRPKIRSLRGASHGKFIHVRLSDDDYARVFHPFHRLRRIGRKKILQDLRTAGGPKPLRAQIVLYNRRYSGQRVGQLSRRDPFLYLLRLLQHRFPVHRHTAVQLPVQLLYPVQRLPDRFHGAGFSCLYRSAQLQGRHTHQTHTVSSC